MRSSVKPPLATLEVPFQVESISQAPAPKGESGVWHRYIISQGMANTITGLRAGTHAEVVVIVGDIVQRLNERRLGNHRPKPKS
jgi:hypothetical protein